MGKPTTNQTAVQLIDELRAIDAKTSEAYYEMGRCLATLEYGSLYTNLGYPSMAEMINEELSFSPATANKYMNTYRHFERLKYKKHEALKLIKLHSFTHLANVLPGITSGQGTRAIANRVKEDRDSIRQVNFAIPAKDYKRLEQLLQVYGAEKQKSGRLLHAAEALLEIVDEFEIPKAA